MSYLSSLTSAGKQRLFGRAEVPERLTVKRAASI
jgi:hypothetical protein